MNYQLNQFVTKTDKENTGKDFTSKMKVGHFSFYLSKIMRDKYKHLQNTAQPVNIEKDRRMESREEGGKEGISSPHPPLLKQLC